MTTRPLTGAAPAAPDADLSARLASAAAQAVRKTHTLTGAIPGRARTAEFKVRFDDGRAAVYRVALERVREVLR